MTNKKYLNLTVQEYQLEYSISGNASSRELDVSK
jgi:hypothetical protein